MLGQIAFRTLTPEDAAAFLEIRLGSILTDPEAYIMSRTEEEKETVASIVTRICSDIVPPEKFVIGAFATTKLIGISAFYQEKWENLRHKGELWGVYVDPQYRQQGIARSLVTQTIEMARLIPGLEQIKLEVSGAMQKRFYESLGFSAWGTEIACTKIADKPVTWEHMTRTL